MAIFIEFVVSILFLVFSIVVAAASVETGIEGREAFFVGPGIFPTMISFALVFLGIWWSTTLAKEHGLKKIISGLNEFSKSLSIAREVSLKISLILVGTLIYVYVLMPYLGFEFATVIFLLCTTIYFGKLKFLYSVVLSLVISFSISYIFGQVLYVPLP